MSTERSGASAIPGAFLKMCWSRQKTSAALIVTMCGRDRRLLLFRGQLSMHLISLRNCSACVLSLQEGLTWVSNVGMDHRIEDKITDLVVR